MEEFRLQQRIFWHRQGGAAVTQATSGKVGFCEEEIRLALA